MPDPSNTQNDLPTRFDRFLHASEPWVLRFVGDESALVSSLFAWQAAHPEVRVHTLDGRQMCWGADYEDELERGLGLPGYYGRNANALNDCLTDEDVLGVQPIVIVVLHADQVLSRESPEMLDSFLDSLRHAGPEWAKPIELGEWWDRGPVPFHALLHTQSPLASLPDL
jgi:RNAse (barnase) inhibitor barstar